MSEDPYAARLRKVANSLLAYATLIDKDGIMLDDALPGIGQAHDELFSLCMEMGDEVKPAGFMPPFEIREDG